MARWSGRKRLAAGGTALLMAVGIGGAFAYWTGGGAGTGTQTNAAGSLPVVISQTALTSGLQPGGSVALAGLLTNPNTADAKVGSLSATVTAVSNGATLSDYTVTGGPVLVNAPVVFGTPLPWSGLTLRYANTAVNQDNGKGATVTISYTVGAFAENVLPPLGTDRVLVVNGVRTFDIYVNMVGTTPLVAGDTLSTYDMSATYGTPAWTDNLATADASGNLRYSAPIPTPGHTYQITIKRAGSMIGNLASLS